MTIQADARIVVNDVNDILTHRGLNLPRRWVLVSRHDRSWLFGIMDEKEMSRMGIYTSNDVLHHLSSALRGKPVLVSNSTGLRYAILLSGKPELPKEVELPGNMEPGVFPIGVDINGPVSAKVGNNVGEWLHILMAGTTGSGKSNFLQVMAWTALVNGWQLYLADPDGHTFNPEHPMWSCCTVAQSLDDLEDMLYRLEEEIARRAALYSVSTNALGMLPQDLDEYNERSNRPLPRILVAIDEANSFFGDKTIAAKVGDLARRGRKWGISLILAAHSWRASDVPRHVSAMFGTRICFKVDDDTSGKVTLGNPRLGKKAMTLNDPGRAILLMRGMSPRIVQVYRMTHQELPPVENKSALEDWQKELVRYAMDELNGCFIIDKLAPVVGEGMSRYRIVELAKQWEKRGWLTAPSHATDPRRVTEELIEVAGLDSVGVV